MNIIFCLLKMNLKKISLYKIDFLFQIIAVVIWISTGLFNIYIIDYNFKNLAGWNFYELNLLYAVWSFTFGIYNAFGNSVLDFDKFVFTGKLDTFLTLPFSSLLMITFSKINIMGLGFILFGFFDIVFSLKFLSVSLIKIVYLFISGITGGILIYSIFLILACLSFYGTKSRELLRTGYNVHKFGQYPFSIYTAGIKILFGYIIPFAFSNFLPVSFVVGKIRNFLIAGMCILLPIILLIFAYAFFCFSLKKYEGTGT